MALSNIFNEPRREITESAIGVAVAAAVLLPTAWASYCVGLWIQDVMPDMPLPAAVLMGFIGAVFGIYIAVLLVLGIHKIGEDVCDALQRRGVHLRPRNRPSQKPPGLDVKAEIWADFEASAIARQRVLRQLSVYRDVQPPPPRVRG